MTFKKQVNGYDRFQVDEFIREQELKAQSCESTLKEKIQLLNQEISQLQSEIANLRQKEGDLTSAMLKIVDLENGYKHQVQELKSVELQRAELFKAKWQECALSICANSGFEAKLFLDFDKMVSEYQGNVIQSINDGLRLRSSSANQVHKDTLAKGSEQLQQGFGDSHNNQVNGNISDSACNSTSAFDTKEQNVQRQTKNEKVYDCDDAEGLVRLCKELGIFEE